MNVSDYIDSVSKKKGANLKATWERPLKVRKSAGDHKVVKLTSAVVRGGIQYENLKSVSEGREDGTLPEENSGLPWGEWAQYPYHITHKEQDYIRLYPASGLNFKPQVEYLLDGVSATAEEVMPLCLASEFEVNKKTWRIQAIEDGELVYWSNEDGWVDKANATRFKGIEKDHVSLPIGEQVKWVNDQPQCFTIKADYLLNIG